MDNQDATTKVLDTLLVGWHQRNGKAIVEASKDLSDEKYSPVFDASWTLVTTNQPIPKTTFCSTNSVPYSPSHDVLTLVDIPRDFLTSHPNPSAQRYCQTTVINLQTQQSHRTRNPTTSCSWTRNHQSRRNQPTLRNNINPVLDFPSSRCILLCPLPVLIVEIHHPSEFAPNPPSDSYSPRFFPCSCAHPSDVHSLQYTWAYRCVYSCENGACGSYLDGYISQFDFTSSGHESRGIDSTAQNNVPHSYQSCEIMVPGLVKEGIVTG